MYANHFGLSNCDRAHTELSSVSLPKENTLSHIRDRTVQIANIGNNLRSRDLAPVFTVFIIIRCRERVSRRRRRVARYDRDILIFDKNIRDNLNDRCRSQDYTAEMAAHFYGRFDERDRRCARARDGAARVLPTRCLYMASRVKIQTEARHTAESTSLRVAKRV